LDSVSTGFGGEFQARVSASSPAALVVVSPPGYALTAFEIPLDGRAAVLRVEAQAGDLELELPVPGADFRQRGLQLVVFQNGRLLSWQSLAIWALANGADRAGLASDRPLLPRLASGAYRACVGPTGGGMALLLGSEAGFSCASGLLGGGERLRLSLLPPAGTPPATPRMGERTPHP
jgi:hypothetical protein